LESAVEKCKSLNITIEKYRKEIETLRERASKANETVIKHEQSLSLTNQELNRCKERLGELETRMHSITLERDMLRGNHERLSKEHEHLMQEAGSRTSILANLELMKAHVERTEREQKLIYGQKIEQLERDNAVQRRQLEQTEEQHAVIVKSWQAQNDRAVQQLERQTTEYEQTKQQLAELRAELETLQQKHNECDAKLHSHELLVQMSRKSAGGASGSSAISRLNHLEEETKEAQSRFALADKEIVSLRIQLEDARAHSKQYKAIADTMERTVRETSEAADKTRQVLEVRIAELAEQLGHAQTQWEQCANEKNELEQRTLIEKQELQENVNVLEQNKESLSADLDLVKRQLDNTEKILKGS
jgi:chromosome segregation ATPase